MLDDLKRKRDKECGSATTYAGGFSNQELSNDPAERVKQLDYQAQKAEERETS